MHTVVLVYQVIPESIVRQTLMNVRPTRVSIRLPASTVSIPTLVHVCPVILAHNVRPTSMNVQALRV
jgi:hypothetical protein